ncbi:bile acid:sodium symporter family protein [Flavitalea sp.]|nr:bile acid:sodium symporter family protein [Flavitalea sp.]
MPNGSGFITVLKKGGLDGFVIALLLMIVVGWLWPQGSMEYNGFSLSQFAGYGVSLIFFFYGLKLDQVKLKAGLRHWKLHMVVQLSTFLLFPVIILCTRWIFDKANYGDIWLAVFFLAALPSTVSSSVVMVSIARGNLVAAIFNASISSLIGIFITPLWLNLVLDADNIGTGTGDTIIKLVIQVLIPVIAGLLLNKHWGAFAEKHKKYFKYFDQFIILLIVYTSFAESFLNKRFENFNLLTLVVLTASMIGLFFIVYFIIRYVCGLLGFNKEDTITAVFCGSKKSLVHGTVMSKVLFSASPLLGVILLPLMIYHAAQLVIASIIARGFNQRPDYPE